MTGFNDLTTLKPKTDDHTHNIIDEACEILGFLRGYRGPYLHDPAVRLHLLASLHQQLTTDLLTTVHDVYEHGYNPTEIAALLNRTPPS